jgi:hypothetical protein
MRRLLSGVLVALAAAIPALGQQPAPTKPAAPDEPPETWIGNRFLQTQSPLTNDKGIFEASFNHRFYTAVVDGGGGKLFGLDDSANVFLYMEYAPVKNLAVQVGRGSLNGDYEFAAKGTLLRPTPSMPLGVGLRGGLNWLTENYAHKQSSGFGQVLVSATLGDVVTIAAAPSYTQRTPSRSSVFNVPLVLEVKITRSTFAMGEYVPAKGGGDRVGQWSFGLQKEMFHHKFGLWIGNSGAQTVDQTLGGDYLGGVTDSNIRLGFSLMRQFDILGGAP